MTDEAFSYDRYLVDQLVRPMINLYRVTPLAAGETPAGGPIAYVRQKRMALKEDIGFYADESETQLLFRIKARSMIDIGGRYDVTDPAGARIGVLEKVFGKSLLRSTWRILAAEEQELATAQERSMAMAILRRAIDFVPDVGGLIPIPYNFDIHVNGDVVGRMDRKFQLRDRYVLDLTGDSEKAVDRRLAIALAIGLDTLQNR
jgi:uncharacterized protein YxjI